MKKLITLFALLCALLSARAQYESFFGRESWKYSEVHGLSCYMDEYNPEIACGCCETKEYFGHKTDTTIINGNTYFRCNGPLWDNFPEVLFLREDTVFGRLYMRTVLDEDSPEYLICDLSLSKGDTFPLPCVFTYWPGWSDTMKMVVDSVRFTSGKKVIDLSLVYDEYDELSHKAYFYNQENSHYYSQYNISLRFMEGVGPIYGIYPTTHPYLGLLLCLHKDDTLFYMTHEDMGCNQFAIWDVTDYPLSSMSVYPNPVGQSITIDFNEDMVIAGSVLIRDLVGRVHKWFQVTENHVIMDVSFLSSGVYLLTYLDENNRKITKKIVKQ